MRRITRSAVIFSLLTCCYVFVAMVGLAQSSNTWSSAGHMTQPRTGAAAVLLSDGRFLITGGSDRNSVPQASCEVFDPSSGTFTETAAMNVPRTNHAAILLMTGDVLVTGGLDDAGGDFSDTAEIYSLATQKWTQLEASLGTGLSGHSMAGLSDGNVLIVGGTSTAGPVSSLLLFKLSDQSINPVGAMIMARSGAATAGTPDGRVLIAGGNDINGAVLASTEIFVYKPATASGTIAAGPAMSSPRTHATATATYDGVAVIGGNDGSSDLGTAEIFSQWSNVFRVVAGGAPTSNHFAAMLPHNGSILTMGGTAGAGVNLLRPWANNAAGAFVAAASSLSDHSGGLAAPGNFGSLLAAGGKGDAGASAEVYWFPIILTDQSDYPPGTPVVMTGTGFQPGETVDLHMHIWSKQTVTDPPDYQVTADDKGTIAFSGYAPDITDLGARYHLTAIGKASGLQAQTVFTDGSTVNVTLALSGNPGTVSNSLNSNTCTWNGTSSSGSGCSFANVANGSPITFTANPGAIWAGEKTWTLTGCAAGSATCAAGPFGNKDGTLTVQLVSVSTTTSASSPAVAYGISATSTVTVTANSGSAAPTGSVTMTVTNGGSASCGQLSGSGVTSTASCTITYGGVGSYTLTPTFTPSGIFTGGSGSATLTVNKANASVTPNAASKTYGAADPAFSGSLTGFVAADNVTATYSRTPGETVGGSPYMIGATLNPAGVLANYNITYNTANFTINKANASVTPNAASKTYGTADPAFTGTLTGFLPADGVTATYSRTAGETVAGGPYTISATLNPAGVLANYKIAYSTANFSINKANATVTVTPYTVSYDGQAHTATAVITGANGETGATVGTVDVSHTSHTNAGTYAGDSWTFTGTANYNNIAATTITDTISKANATVNVTPYTATYDGLQHTATATITGVNGETGSPVGTVNLNNTTHTNAGTYASDSWSFTGAANYNDMAATTITDTINKANADIIVKPYMVTYDGTAHTATVASITGVNGETGAAVGAVDVNNTSHTDAGTYTTDSWSFTPTANYNSIAATTITDTINKANADVVVTPYTVTYDGAPHTATVASIIGVHGESGATVGTVNLSTTHTGAGSYPNDSWSFSGTANYSDIAATRITDTINKANAIITVNGYSGKYDGMEHGATGSAVGVESPAPANLDSLLHLGDSFTDVPGGTAHWTFDGNTNYMPGSGDAVITITRADATIDVKGYSGTYDSNAHGATGTAIGVEGESLSSLLHLGSSFTDAPGGTASWNFAGNNNYMQASGSAEITITKADGIVAINGYSGKYDGTAHGATGTAKGVKGEDLSNLLNLGSAFTDVPGGTASWSFAGNTNYMAASGSKAITITKADANLKVTGYTVTYDGKQHTATGTATGAKGEALSGLDLSQTAHTDAGTFSDTWTFTDSTGNYNNSTATVSDVVNKALVTITAGSYKGVYDGSSHAPSDCKIAAPNALGYIGGLTCTNSPTSVGPDVNSGTVTPSISGNNRSNFTITQVNGAWNITKAESTVKLTCSGQTYNGSAQTPCTATATGAGDLNQTLTVDYTNNVNAGAATASASFQGDSNHNSSSNSTTFTINKAILTVTASDASVYFGDPAPAITPKITGFVNSETQSVLTTMPTCSVQDYNSTTPVGSTPATSCSGGVAANYIFKDVNGTLTIKGWTTTGFYSPVIPTTPGGTIVWNAIKGGSTVPLKFNIAAGTVQKTSATAVKGQSIGAYQVSCNTDGYVNTATDLLENTGATALRFDTTSQQFIQNWKTPKGSACYAAQMTAADGSTLLAFFKAN